jgi:putative ABC transport system permease protein
MSVRSTALMARKSLRARLGRTFVIGIAITAGVSFVVGSFVLADSLKNTFDNLFAEVNAAVDLEVRSTTEFDTNSSRRDPLSDELVDQIRAVPGVAVVAPFLQRTAQFVTADGKIVATQGAPTFGVSWSESTELSGLRLREGRFPVGIEEVGIDKATADRERIRLGDSVEVITDAGRFPFVIAGIVSLGNADGFGGATLAVFDFPTAQAVFAADNLADAISISVAEGFEIAQVQAAIAAILPPRAEVITGEQVVEEAGAGIATAISAFGTGLLIFAFITSFVSAFIINNVFAITIGQRLRELALMRAVGASARQVSRMIILEALVMSVIATAAGILGGIGVARLMIAFFNATGLGFPETGTTLMARTVIVAAAVGVGITVVSVSIPARRASRIPPVAAMRPELGFAALNTRRLIGGVIVTVIGAISFLIGLFIRPGGTPGLIFFAAGGGLALFLGTASISSTIARPVTAVIGWPVAKMLRTPGVLARLNAGRSPRRTSASASALMIGVALVSAAAVFAASVRDTFIQVLDRSVTADYVITDSSFQGLTTEVAATLRSLPELSAVSPIRGAPALLNGDRIAIGAADPVALGELLNLDLQRGGYEALTLNKVLVHEDSAATRNLDLGSVVSLTFQNGEEVDLEVVGIYADAAVAGNWLISLETIEAISPLPPRDFFVVAKLAPGVEAAIGDAAVRAAMEPFPQAQVQTNAEFRQEQEDQINQLLLIITGLLLFSILIAILGISITLALSVYERTREIGLLRAVGMTKRQARRAVRWEAVIVSVFGAVIGVALGSLIGIALAIAVPDSVIETVSFSPSTTVIIMIGAILAGLLAALYPSYKASRMNVLEAIATE